MILKKCMTLRGQKYTSIHFAISQPGGEVYLSPQVHMMQLDL